jgi:Kdo2-lipid IVA lauroyltransferase/acyltransferase
LNKKQFINRVGLGILTFGQNFFGVSDIEKCEKRGARLGMLLFAIDKKHRNRALQNVAMVFPEKSTQEQKKLVKDMFRHFGRVVADFMRSPVRTDEELRSSITIVGREHFEKGYGEGKGIFCITCHLGNWERFAHHLRLEGVPFSSVARDTNDDEVTQYVNKIRSKNGMSVLSRGKAAREILVRLKNGEVIGLLPDQNADEAFIPFFGIPAGTVVGPARLHMKTGAPLMPCCCIWNSPGKYTAYISECIYAKEGETAEELMARVNLEIEKLIRIAPEQYLWMHDRWKNARIAGLL